MEEQSRSSRTVGGDDEPRPPDAALDARDSGNRAGEHLQEGRRAVIVGGPSREEVMDAFAAWPDPLLVLFRFEDGREGTFELVKLIDDPQQQRKSPDDWNFVAIPRDAGTRAPGRQFARGSYSTASRRGFVTLDSLQPEREDEMAADPPDTRTRSPRAPSWPSSASAVADSEYSA